MPILLLTVALIPTLATAQPLGPYAGLAATSDGSVLYFSTGDTVYQANDHEIHELAKASGPYAP